MKVLIPRIKHQTASRVQIDFISFIPSYPQADAKFEFLQLEIETENNLSLTQGDTRRKLIIYFHKIPSV